MPDYPEIPCVAEAKAWKEAYEAAEALYEEFVDARNEWLLDSLQAAAACNPVTLATIIGAGACAGLAGHAWQEYWEAEAAKTAAQNAANTANALLDDYFECYCNPDIPWFEP